MPPETPDKDRKPTAREISAGIVVFRRTPEGPKFLILYHGGAYWNFPKGKIENEEKDLAAALRETKEEAGIAPRDLHIVPNFKAYERFSFRHDGHGIFKIVIFYLAETRVTDIKIEAHRHQGYGWFSFREASKILGNYRDSQKVLRQAFEFLRPRTPTAPGAQRSLTPRIQPAPRNQTPPQQRPHRPQSQHAR